MKTITLDEVAYRRLKVWKKGSNESFSSVIKRIVPEPGSLGAFLNFVETHDPASLPGNEEMETALNASRSPAKSDPWS